MLPINVEFTDSPDGPQIYQTSRQATIIWEPRFPPKDGSVKPSTIPPNNAVKLNNANVRNSLGKISTASKQFADAVIQDHAALDMLSKQSNVRRNLGDTFVHQRLGIRRCEHAE